ncbi:MAG TPA: DUF5916 domain-containing protein [Acidobacteriota bacterium]|nr:DUF5916 domain-containing protein [Acidobacteriota bacterium]
MKLNVVLSSLLLIPILIAAGINVQAGEKRDEARYAYRIPETNESIEINGVLDDSVWENALRVDLKYETSPGENVKPPVETEAYLIHNHSYLYVAFKAYDPEPAAIRAHLSDRDSIYGDDNVGILLDTFNDELRAFQFECNPIGIQRDVMRNDAVSSHGRWRGDPSWDAIWDSAGRITDWGYAVEMAIPFNALSFPRANGDEQQWGFIVSRNYARNVHHSIQNVPNDRGRNCEVCQAAKISGFTGITPGRNIEFNPTITGINAEDWEDFPEGGEMTRVASKFEAGLTTRWGITPNMIFNVAVNPDFSQVEADAYQLDINRTFEIRYDEKRPFFLEGADFFNTQMNAVYTRSIANPSWGVKLTGKEGANALGVYVARDDVTNLVFPGANGSSSELYETETTSSVFRYRRDVMNSSTIGVLFTDREGGDYYNRLFGFDSKLRLTDTDTVTFQALGSSTQYERDTALEQEQPLEVFSDWAHQLQYEHNTRDWNFSLAHSRMGEGFRADLGFIPRVGYQRYSTGIGRTWYGGSDDLIQMVFLEGNYSQMDEAKGGLLERQFRTMLFMEGAMQSTLVYNFQRSRQVYEELSAVQNRHSFRFGARPFSELRLALRAFIGDEIDYSNVREGFRISLAPEVSINLGRHLFVNLEHSINRMSVDEGRLYFANVTQTRAVYQFNPRMFFRAIFQYVDIRRDTALYINEDDEEEIDPLSRRLFTQLLFSYKLNPRTVLFLGYSDNYRGYIDYGLTQVNRTFFMKIGYAWML